MGKHAATRRRARPWGRIRSSNSTSAGSEVLMSIHASRPPRLQPTVPVSTVAFVVYAVIFMGLMKMSEFAYTDIFSTAEGSLRAAVLPLTAGLLIAGPWLFCQKDV